MRRRLNRLEETALRKLYKFLYYVKRALFTPRKAHFSTNKVGVTRASWESTFLSLWEPLFRHFSRGKAGIIIDGPHLSSGGKASDSYEGFARSFIGVAFYLHLKASSTVVLSSGEKVDLAALYREGIVNGTNPEHEEYWGYIRSDQKLVENGSVAMGLLLTRQHIWDRLSPAEKDRVTTWFRDCVTHDFHINNWQWFKIFHYLFLEQTGYEFDSADLERTLDNIEEMYCRDGWYTDGFREGEYRFDYYTAWAMHFYSLMFCYLAGNSHHERQQKYLDRSRQFSRDYQYFFTPHGHPPLYGRSQLYRFASLSSWGISLRLDYSGADPGWIKKSAIDTLNAFLEKGAVGQNGILSMGYYREFTPMLERYSGPGSPYWAFKGFSFLLLPEDHSFWDLDASEVSPRERVYPIEVAKMILLHSSDSHVILLNAGSNSDYPLKYDKFAYSNTFLMNYDFHNPIDNTLMLGRENSSWGFQRTFLDTACRDNVCNSRWKIKDTIVNTNLIGMPNGYIAVHQLCSGSRFLFQAGGFPLAQAQRRIERNMDIKGVALGGENRQTGIRLLFGKAQPFIYMKKGVNPAGRYAFVPCLRGAFGDNEKIFVIAVWAAKSAEVFEIPLVTVSQKTCTLKWRDREQQIALD